MNFSTQRPILPSNCVNYKERESLSLEHLLKYKVLIHQFATSKADRWANTFPEKIGIWSSNCVKCFEYS